MPQWAGCWRAVGGVGAESRDLGEAAGYVFICRTEGGGTLAGLAGLRFLGPGKTRLPSCGTLAAQKVQRWVA